MFRTIEREKAMRVRRSHQRRLGGTEIEPSNISEEPSLSGDSFSKAYDLSIVGSERRRGKLKQKSHKVMRDEEELSR